ncbi:MAG: hypothetical protein M1816_004301 [Peltula sp. TS41687]|nr:MAG: hypothetical protein M1816_004301 [Peltula sp. TS41687]
MRPLVVLLTSILTCATIGTTSPIARQEPGERLFPDEGGGRDLSEEHEKASRPAAEPGIPTDVRSVAELVGGSALLGVGVMTGASISDRARSEGFESGRKSGLEEVSLRERQHGRKEGYGDAVAEGHGSAHTAQCIALTEFLRIRIPERIPYDYPQLLEVIEECLDNPAAAKRMSERQLMEVVKLAREHPAYAQTMRRLEQEARGPKHRPGSQPEQPDTPPTQSPSQFSLDQPAKGMWDKFSSFVGTVQRNAQAKSGSFMAPAAAGGFAPVRNIGAL